MDTEIQPYDRSRDLEAVDRIWREVGWLEDDDKIESLDRFLSASHVEAGLIDGSAECAVCWTPGSMRYQDTDLRLCAVTAVTTSRIGRKQRLATTMTARAVADGARRGAHVAALGMFEQGFYDRIGFGSGPYEQQVTFDPTSLRLGHVPYRRPVRLGVGDHEELHGALTRRHRGHGSVVLDPPAIVHSECEWISGPFGLGYRNDGGRLTHFLFGGATGEHGPYKITMLAYEEPAQLLELLRLLTELGDQVSSIRMDEPAAIQFQDLLRTPFRLMRQSDGSAHATGVRSSAWMQLRILDLAACIGARTWPGPPVRFNLVLTDPAPDLLDGAWAGVGGTYVVAVGAPSTIESGTDAALPTLEATVNAFSRLWFAVRPATSLALTDQVDAPLALLRDLDAALALPPPKPGWDF